MDGGTWQAAVHGVTKSRTRLSDFTFTFHFHALEKEMATHSSVLAWRVPGTGRGLVGCYLWGHTESDTTDVTQHSKIEEIPARCRDKMVGLLKLQCEPRFRLRVDVQLSLYQHRLQLLMMMQAEVGRRVEVIGSLCYLHREWLCRVPRSLVALVSSQSLQLQYT